MCAPSLVPPKPIRRLRDLTRYRRCLILAFDPEIRKVVCSTNAIESVNARIHRAVRARGHFPNEQAALKFVYMAVRAWTPPGRAVNGGSPGGKPPATRSKSPSKDACPQVESRHTIRSSYTVILTDPPALPLRFRRWGQRSSGMH